MLLQDMHQHSTCQGCKAAEHCIPGSAVNPKV